MKIELAPVMETEKSVLRQGNEYLLLQGHEWPLARGIIGRRGGDVRGDQGSGLDAIVCSLVGEGSCSFGVVLEYESDSVHRDNDKPQKM